MAAAMRHTDPAAIRAAAVAECIAIVLKRMGSDWTANAVLAELRALLPKETP